MVEVKEKGTKPILQGAIVASEVTLDEMLASTRGELLAGRSSVEMTIRSNMGWEIVQVKVVFTGFDHDVVGLESELWRYRAVVVECQDRPELLGLRVDGDINFHNPQGVSDYRGLFTCYEARKGSSM